MARKKEESEESEEKSGGGLDGLLASINKKYGEGTILRASDAARLKLSRIPYGVPILDAATGGGIPRGRITLHRGTESAGKSLLAYLAIIQAQSLCRRCAMPFRIVDPETQEEVFLDCTCKKCEPHIAAVIDAESSFDRAWFAKLGGNNDLVLVQQSEYAEQAIDVADHVLRSREVDIVMIDSIAALSPSKEIEESVEKKSMGAQAQLLTKAYRKWQSALNEGSLNGPTPPTIILINQLRYKIGVVYGSPITSPGGEAVNKFGPSLVLELQRKKPIKPGSAKKKDDDNESEDDNDDSNAVGVNVAFKVAKNKTAPAFRVGTYEVYFSDYEGYKAGDTDRAGQVFRLALAWNLIEKSGSWFKLPDGSKFQGEGQMLAHLKENPALYQALFERVSELEGTYNAKPVSSTSAG